MLINTWTGDYKYPVAQCENLPFPIKMISSLKPKTFSEFFFHLWNLHQILNIFKKKKIVIANVFPKLQTVKDLVRPFAKKRRVITSLDSQHAKGSQILVKTS